MLPLCMCRFDIALNISGVTTMPVRFDAVAEQTAAGMLPRALDVRAIDDCTVDGSAQRNKTPRYNGPGNRFGNAAIRPRPSIGNKMKVAAPEAACSRQC